MAARNHNSFLNTDGDLAGAIVTQCGDPETQIACVDDTDFCKNEAGTDYASNTGPVEIAGGETVFIYIGACKHSYRSIPT